MPVQAQVAESSTESTTEAIAASDVLSRLKALKSGTSAPVRPPNFVQNSQATVSQPENDVMSRLKALKAGVGTPSAPTTNVDSTKPASTPFVPFNPAGGIRPPLTTLEHLRNFGRDTVNALPAAGMAIGGTLGDIPGAMIGGMAGKTAQNLFHAAGVGDVPPPTAPSDVIQELGISGLEGGAAQVLGNAVHGALTIPTSGIKLPSILERPSIELMRAVKPTEPGFHEIVPTVMSELKADKIAVPRNLPMARASIQRRITANNSMFDNLMRLQHNIVESGSRQAVANAEITAIPEDIRLNDPDKYARLVADAQSKANLPDYTRGQLNELRKDLNATNSPYYGKDLSGQITMDRGVRAMDMARGDTVRNLLYNSLDTSGAGMGDTAREINRRMGALIHFDDALRPRENEALLQTGKSLASKAATPVKSVKEHFTDPTIDQTIARTLARWKSTPEPIPTKFAAPNSPTPTAPPVKMAGKPTPGKAVIPQATTASPLPRGAQLLTGNQPTNPTFVTSRGQRMIPAQTATNVNGPFASSKTPMQMPGNTVIDAEFVDPKQLTTNLTELPGGGYKSSEQFSTHPVKEGPVPPPRNSTVMPTATAPSNPHVGDRFLYQDRVWTYTGSKWEMTGPRLIGSSTTVKTPPLPPESFADTLARTQTPQSALMRETMGKGPYDKQARPATAEEYLRTKGGTNMPSGEKSAGTPPRKVTTSNANPPDAPYLHREANMDELLDYLPNTTRTVGSAMRMSDIYMHSNPDLALGQGASKGGIKLQFDPSRLNLTKSMKKPGAGISETVGGGTEFVGWQNDQAAYQAALRKITLPGELNKNAGGKAVAIKRMLNDLEKQGWVKMLNSDGTITYMRP